MVPSVVLRNEYSCWDFARVHKTPISLSVHHSTTPPESVIIVAAEIQDTACMRVKINIDRVAAYVSGLGSRQT